MRDPDEVDDYEPFETVEELFETFELELLKNPQLSDEDRQAVMEMDDDDA